MNKLKEMNGNEIWSDSFGERFGERVCILIQYPKCICNGKKFTPNSKEIKGLFDDLMIQEFGSKQQMMKELVEEFGG